MVRAPEWTEIEFKTVIYNPQLSDEELAQKLETRSTDAVAIVRDGIHRFHTGKENCGILSKMMINMLQKRQRPITCHKCKGRL